MQGTGWSASQLLSFEDSIETMKNKRKSAGGPVSRILSWTVIPLGAALPRTLISDLPGGFGCGDLRHRRAHVGAPGRHATRRRLGQPAVSLPIWSCSVWGLPCLRPYGRSGALLPHLFTLTLAACARWRYVFCGTGRLRALTPDPGRYPAHCPAEFGLSSPGTTSAPAATAQPACTFILRERTGSLSLHQSPVGMIPAFSTIRMTVRCGARVRCRTPLGTTMPCHGASSTVRSSRSMSNCPSTT